MVIAPSILCHDQFSPFNSSYTSNPLCHGFRNTPACVHSLNRRWAVELEQIPVALNAFHWQPVRATNRIASIASRSLRRCRPRPSGSSFTCTGNNGSTNAQNSSEHRHRFDCIPASAFPGIHARKAHRPSARFWDRLLGECSVDSDEVAARVGGFKGMPCLYKPGKCTGNETTACAMDADCTAQSTTGPYILCP